MACPRGSAGGAAATADTLLHIREAVRVDDVNRHTDAPHQDSSKHHAIQPFDARALLRLCIPAILGAEEAADREHAFFLCKT